MTQCQCITEPFRHSWELHDCCVGAVVVLSQCQIETCPDLLLQRAIFSVPLLFHMGSKRAMVVSLFCLACRCGGAKNAQTMKKLCGELMFVASTMLMIILIFLKHSLII